MKKLSKTALHILDIATDLFAEHGYNGTIMDTLAEKAKVNKASIYYHFQDKANLYSHCAEQLFKGVVDPIMLAVENTEPTPDKLTVLITTFAEYAHQKPQMPALLMREFASGGMNMPIPARKQMQRILIKLKEIIESGTKENLFISVDPFATQIMIVGAISLFVTSQPMRQAIKTDIPLDPNLDEAIADVAKIILNGLKKN